MPNMRYDDDYFGSVPRQKEASAPPAPRPAIGARREPEGTHILDNHRRVGDTQRDTYLNHLSDLHARGYLGKEEFEARQAAAQKAEAEWDLNRLVADLPGLIEPRVPSLRRAIRSPASLLSWLAANKGRKPFGIALAALGILAAIAWAMVPAGLLGFYNTPQTGFAQVMVAFFVVTGVVSLFAGILGMVYACTEMD